MRAGSSWRPWHASIVDATGAFLRHEVTEPVFAHHITGQPFDPRRDWQTWVDLVASAGVRVKEGGGVDVRPHDSRHHVATTLLLSGMDAVAVAGYLGHGTPMTTLLLYSHFTTDASAAVAARMEQISAATVTPLRKAD